MLRYQNSARRVHPAALVHRRIMDSGIGRLLIASLHQGIADVVPDRLEFYDHWFRPPSVRHRRFGLGPLNAVLSFLRLEGQHTYEAVMTAAGRYTAEWSHSGMSPFIRGVLGRLPAAVRARCVLGLLRRLVAETFRGSRASTELRRGRGAVGLRGSIFCVLREKTTAPMCAFYAAATERLLLLFDLDAEVRIEQCQAVGADRCVISVAIRGAGRAAAAPAEAA